MCGRTKMEKVRWRSRRRRLRRRRRRDYCATADDSDASVCDASKHGRRHPAKLLTDLNNPSNRTCWISAPTSPSEDNAVNITINFGKKYEVGGWKKLNHQLQRFNMCILNRCLKWDKWVLNELIPSRQWFNTLIPRSRTFHSAAYIMFVWSRLSAPVELSTRCTTPHTTVECDSGIKQWRFYRGGMGWLKAEATPKKPRTTP